MLNRESFLLRQFAVSFCCYLLGKGSLYPNVIIKALLRKCSPSSLLMLSNPKR